MRTVKRSLGRLQVALNPLRVRPVPRRVPKAHLVAPAPAAPQPVGLRLSEQPAGVRRLCGAGAPLPAGRQDGAQDAQEGAVRPRRLVSALWTRRLLARVRVSVRPHVSERLRRLLRDAGYYFE